MKNKETIGREVLEVYKKQSPSSIKIEDSDVFGKFCKWQNRLWQNCLKIPIRALNKSVIFDYGCGTGEIDVFLSLQGAYINGIDFNPDSIERAQKLAGKFGLSSQMNFNVADIHEPVFPSHEADFVISFGVLPHVYDPEKVFVNMVNSCKNGGFIIVGFVEELGIVQRLLHRSIIRAIAGFDEDRIVRIAKQAFPDHINRSVRFGQRTENSVIFDYLVNRHMYGLPLEKVLTWFINSNVTYYSSWPLIDMPFQINPYTSEPLLLTHPICKEFRAFLRLRWLFAQHEDDSVFNELFEKIEKLSIFNVIDDFQHMISVLVQKQDQNWSDKELNDVINCAKKINTDIDRFISEIYKYIAKEIATAINALNEVLANIVMLQRKEKDEFKGITGLFKELNGLGTLYLAGIVSKDEK